MELTMLNSMAGKDFPVALDRHVALGLRLVDLKDGIWGKKVEELDPGEAARAAALVRERGLSVHCLSTGLGWNDASIGELAWKENEGRMLGQVLRSAEVLGPRYVRILAARDSGGGAASRSSFGQTIKANPWLAGAYADLVLRIADAGLVACIENEARNCALAAPEDVVDFFGFLRPLIGSTPCDYIWDVQNMWQMGTFPSLAGYEKMRPFVRSIHLKGGRAGTHQVLAEACGLRDASWPVLEIVREVRRVDRVEVICLNPSHGFRPPSYDVWGMVQDDIAFLRENFPSLESRVAPVSET